jgi:hypothetical protein
MSIICSLCDYLVKYYYDNSICHMPRLENLDVLLHPIIISGLALCS